jgi:NADH-quinone oxidoreductase subunit L
MSPTLIWLIPLAPLVAMIICAAGSIMGLFKHRAHIPCWIALGISAVLSLWALWTTDFASGVLIVEGYTWLSLGRVQVRTALQLDVLSMFQLTVVTVVSLLVAIYSQAYMKNDAGYARYFAIFSGFVFSMTMLVLASNLLVMYVFWEGVGLCSYLLVGYWFQRPSAAKAATKAFLVNRVADCAFLSGILVLTYAVRLVISTETSPTERLNFAVIFDLAPIIAANHPSLLGFVGVCLLIGAIGKSAQFPLHVWLPDAMEGPTPASALIHAATMVTAGVFLLARMSPLLELTPNVLVMAAWIGGITAFLAAAIALFQDDLKRVLAYSTVSQLGFMFMAIGAGGGRGLIAVAVMAGMFHLCTHAFFKALLFLGAGNVMHAMGDVIDMRSFSGLRKVLPKTYFLFGLGALALAGIPPLAGFWSKDGILALLFEASKDLDHGTSFMALFGVALVTAFMTAVYTFRAFFRTFHGPLRLPREAGDHPHEANVVQLSPMIVLAVGSIVAGVALGPSGILSKLFEFLPELPKLSEHHGHEGVGIAAVSSVVSISGVIIAWLTTLRRPDEAAHPSRNPLVIAGANRFFIDEVYDLFLVRPIQAFADLVGAFDAGFVGTFWKRMLSTVFRTGDLFRKMQTGLLPHYAIALAMASLLILAVVVLS